MFLVILLYAISATTFLVGKAVLAFCSPLLLTGLRTFFAGLLMLAYIKFKKQKIEVASCLISLIGIAFFSFYLSNTLKFWSLQNVSSYHASVIYLLEPLFAAIFSCFLLTEKITLKQSFYLALSILGAFISFNGFSLNNFNFSFSLYNLILICSVACSAYGAILIRSVLLKNQSSIITVNSMSMLFAGILSLFSSFAFGEFSLNLNNLSSFLPLLILMILISNIFAYNLYGILLKKYSAVFISCASFLRPVFVSCYNCILFNEPTNWIVILSGFIIFSGLFLFYAEENNIKINLPRFIRIR